MNKTNYKKGDYVVLLSCCRGDNCWDPNMPMEYCYRLAKDSAVNSFYPELDNTGSRGNGWSCLNPGVSGVDKLHLRLATSEEIIEYEKYRRPFKISKLSQIINNYQIY